MEIKLKPGRKVDNPIKEVILTQVWGSLVLFWYKPKFVFSSMAPLF